MVSTTAKIKAQLDQLSFNRPLQALLVRSYFKLTYFKSLREAAVVDMWTCIMQSCMGVGLLDDFGLLPVRPNATYSRLRYGVLVRILHED